jgi:hypothetical protein
VFRRIKFALVGLACLLLLPGTVAPAMAAGPSSPPPPSSPGVMSGTITMAQLQALAASVPAPTAAQLAIAKKMAASYNWTTTSSVQYSPPSGGKVSPDVNVNVNWWGVYIHLTQNDVHQEWDIIWAAGIGAGAGILCAEGGPLLIVCAIVGAAIAYLVAEVIWNYIGYYVPSCGVHIGYYWYGQWYWGKC